jgi:hypothetical protein
MVASTPATTPSAIVVIKGTQRGSRLPLSNGQDNTLPNVSSPQIPIHVSVLGQQQHLVLVNHGRNAPYARLCHMMSRVGADTLQEFHMTYGDIIFDAQRRTEVWVHLEMVPCLK